MQNKNKQPGGRRKRCAYCDEPFVSANKKQTFCSEECREAEEHRLQKERHKVRQSGVFAPVFAYIDRVYRETGVYLSYGKAVVRMQMERDAEERKGKKEQVEEKDARVYAKRKE